LIKNSTPLSFEDACCFLNIWRSCRFFSGIEGKSEQHIIHGYFFHKNKHKKLYIFVKKALKKRVRCGKMGEIEFFGIAR
jgi:hypothetical protein